jgi:hypothetical protein
MTKRWPITSDPKFLTRVAEQERRNERAIHAVVSPKPKIAREGGGEPARAKVGLSAATKRAQRVALNNQDSRRDSLSYDEVENALTIVLAGAELLSHNVSLRMHNAKTTQLKSTWSKRMEALMVMNLSAYDRWKKNQHRAFPLLVEEVYASGEAHCLDVESVYAGCKPIIDALVRTKFIPDDKVEFIAQLIAYTYRQPNKGLVLVLRPAPKPWGLINDRTMQIAKSIPWLPE